MTYLPCIHGTDGTTARSRHILCRICNATSGSHYHKQVSVRDCAKCTIRDTSYYDSSHHSSNSLNVAMATHTNDSIPQMPSLPTRLVTYTDAVARWIECGRPTRTDDEVTTIYDQHCKSCNWRKKRTNMCRGCGCHVASKGMALTNKIKMATEHCPRDKW